MLFYAPVTPISSPKLANSKLKNVSLSSRKNSVLVLKTDLDP